MNPQIPADDHELLVVLYTEFNSFKESYKKDINALNINISKFATRVSSSQLALDDRIRETEKSLVKVDSIKEDIDDLQKRSNMWDGLIGAFSVLGSILGIIFGSKSS